MTAYRTCRNCLFQKVECPRRAEIAAAVKGIGLTSLAFRCTLRKPLYRAGQRAQVTWKYFPPDWGYEEGCSLETWPATVVQETKKGFLIAVDDVDSDNDLPAREYIKSDSLFCNVVAGKLAPIDEPDRAVCSYCLCPANGAGGVAGNCWGDNGLGEPVTKDCLRAALARDSNSDPKGENSRSEAECEASQSGTRDSAGIAQPLPPESSK
jgi:hypothetical protein